MRLLAGLLLVAAAASLAWPAPGVAAPAAQTQLFSSTAPITIVDSVVGPWPTPANPYPATLTVSGMAGRLSRVVVSLNSVSHTYTSDIDILLQAPDGRVVILMSDVVGDFDLTGQTLVFADAALAHFLPPRTSILPLEWPLSSFNPWRPTNQLDSDNGSNDPFPGTVPQATLTNPYNQRLSSLSGINANGDWKLWVVDDKPNDQGVIAGGWALEITTLPPLPTNAFALTNSSPPRLLSLNWEQPSVINHSVPISGLQSGETLMSLDVRPTTGQLFGLGTDSRLYWINPNSGFALQMGPRFNPPLEGTAFALDFDPLLDRLRIIGDADRNYAVDPITASLVVSATSVFYPSSDSLGAGQSPTVTGIAYSNSRPGAGTTTLFGIDNGLDSLLRIGGVGQVPSPDSGLLTSIGRLRFVEPFGALTSHTATSGAWNYGITADNGFEIISLTGVPDVALLAGIRPGDIVSTLSRVDLATGIVRPIGDSVETAIIGGGAVIRGFTIYTDVGGPARATLPATFRTKAAGAAGW